MSLIPVRCFTCGEILADKYSWYLDRVKTEKAEKGIETSSVQYIDKVATVVETPEAKAMNTLGLFKQCCRRHMLTHVDI